MKQSICDMTYSVKTKIRYHNTNKNKTWRWIRHSCIIKKYKQRFLRSLIHVQEEECLWKITNSQLFTFFSSQKREGWEDHDCMGATSWLMDLFDDWKADRVYECKG